MLKNNEFVGLALEGNIIRIAHLKREGGALHLQKLDKVALVESVEDRKESEVISDDDLFADPFAGKEESANIFGFEETAQPGTSKNGNDENEIHFEDMEVEVQSDEAKASQSLDMVSETKEEPSNALVLFDILSRFSNRSIQLGLNIPAGDTIFQIIKDTDFSQVKSKNLVEDIENKLESIYNEPSKKDNYSYHVREDGSLILASVKEESPLLSVINEAKEFYSGKIRIRSIYPDEVALASLVRKNYQLKPSEITAILQFGMKSCRLLFMQGDEILRVAPLISRGTDQNQTLKTVFSKLLYELDTGKVPGIDQIIIANNLPGQKAVKYFGHNFPNITVKELTYDKELLHHDGIDSNTINPFSAAVAAAWAASEGGDFADLSFLPAYVEERQKIFKLKWHGNALLILIFLVPFVFNYYYQQNRAEIESLSTQLELINTRITQIEPIVQRTQEVSQNLTLLTNKLSLIDSLSTGSKAWSAKFSILNGGMNSITNSWFTSMTKTQEGIFIEGYSRYRNRIPAIVNIFAEATLLNVSMEKIRDEEIYQFAILVKAFAGDSTLYSPDQPENIRQLLANS